MESQLGNLKLGINKFGSRVASGWKKVVQAKEKASLIGLSMLASTQAYAELPELQEPDAGTGDGLMDTIRNYAADFAVFGGLLIVTVMFIWVAIAALAAFNEARQKDNWGKFGVVICVGVILIVVGIWLANKAADIL